MSLHIEEELARSHAKLTQAVIIASGDLAQILNATFQYVCDGFDIHAYYHLYLLGDYEDITDWYEKYLNVAAGNSINYAKDRVARWPPATAKGLLQALETHLIGRRSHWKAEAFKWVRELKSRIAERAGPSARPADSEKSARHVREPKPNLLMNAETVNRKTAAMALGITERTLDRWIADGKLTPIGVASRKRFKSKELLRILKGKIQEI